MEASNPGEGSWIARGICLAPVILTVVYAHRRTLARLWNGPEERDEKGRVIAPATAVAPPSAAVLPSPSPPRPRAASPSSARFVEDKERDEDEAQAELYIIQRTIVRLARTGDVDGLIALLESIEEEEQNRAGHSDTQAWKEGQSSSTGPTTPHDHLLNFIFDLPTRPTAHRRTHTERRARRRVQTSTSEAEAEAEEELEPCEDERHGAEAGCTPLFVAALNGRAQMVQLLLERGARPGLRSTRGGVHPLYAACLEGHADVVRVLLSSGGDAAVDFNEIGVEADGSTALMGCCEGGHTALARLLLNRGADVGARGRSGATALFYATQQGHDHLVRLLASHHRCDVNARKNDGSTALFLAVVSGRADIVRILLAAGADPSVRAKNGDTPLDIATKLRSCFPAVYDALMDHKEGTGCVPIGSSSTSRS